MMQYVMAYVGSLEDGFNGQTWPFFVISYRPELVEVWFKNFLMEHWDC